MLERYLFSTAYDTAAYILRGDYAQLNFPDQKHQLNSNSLSGSTKALLEAKLQAIESQAQRKKTVEDPVSLQSSEPSQISSKNSSMEDLKLKVLREEPLKKELIELDNKFSGEVLGDMEGGGGIQLSRMPSLDMDMIWDAIL
uniref:Uncharacterized protein n=1 Tax=Kalanchoe fedtschenkoi TaxID=63787 RepID=A0A7N0V6X8_KALFE